MFSCFLGSTIALAQNDLKKIIAYSTLAQIGYMLVLCGFSSFSFSFYHLFNHAFLCVVIIYNLVCMVVFKVNKFVFVILFLLFFL